MRARYLDWIRSLSGYLFSAHRKQLDHDQKLDGVTMTSSDPSYQDALEDVLTFWFVENGVEQWFAKSDAFDDAIRDRFGDLLDTLISDPEQTKTVAARSSRNALASLVVLDQFSRNLFRGKAKAFAQDAMAREIARHAIAKGFHVAVDLPEKGALFFVLPFEHSEDLTDQDWSCALMTPLMGEEFGKYAQDHWDVVARFGRFPYRNAALGRVNTAEEQAFIDTPGTGF